ncbi:MAG TPA: winged helix-turn-helix domain-containing protein [Tahibacter sp.]|nr:winged helix-turn-helix domain-containing protein [Tahibacter sp.]
MQRTEAQLLRIGTVVVDLRYSRLMRDGREISLTPRAFELLALFLSRPGVLLVREEIFRLVWKDVLVEDANLTQTVWLLRRALGPEGKAWISTVSKRGYVFEGPLIEVLDVVPGESAMIEAAEPAAPAEPVEPAEPVIEPMPLKTVAADATPRRATMRKPLLAGVAVVALLAVLAVLRFVSFPPISDEPGRVVIVDAVGDTDSDDAHLAVVLAHEWIAWQLGDLHLTDVVSAVSGSSVGATGNADRVLLLSARLDDSRARIVVDAQLVGRGKSGQWQAEGAIADLPQVVDVIARKVVRQLVSGAPEYADVTFALSLDVARRYAAALYARRDGNRAKMQSDLEDVVRRAPRFDLARLQLAWRLADLGQVTQAREHLTALSAWIARLPPELRGLIDARRAEIAQDFAAAAHDYAALARAYPWQWRFRFDAARNLLNDDRAGEALSMLDEQALDTQSMRLRAQWLLLRANAQLELGAAQDARATARRAMALVASDDEVNTQATVVDVFADSLTTGDPVDVEILRRAALSFEANGDELRALDTNLAAVALEPTPSDVRLEAAIDALLSKAHMAGNVGLEVLALRRSARLALRKGEFDKYRRRLADAHDVALAAGNSVQLRRVGADLLYDEMQRGDYVAARRREASWRNDALPGSAGVDLGIMLARFAIATGDFSGALTKLTALAQADRIDPQTTIQSVVTARLSCVQANVQLRQGLLEQARRSYTHCAEASPLLDRRTGRIGLAAVALASGDDDGARSRIEALRTIVDPGVDAGPHVTQSIDLVGVLQQLGLHAEARRIVDEELAYARRSGFRQLEGIARLHLAELALVDRRVDDAAEELRLARALLPADAWGEGATARLLEAAIALVRGDAAMAWPILTALSKEARARGDMIVLLEAMCLAGEQLDAIGSSKSAYDAQVVDSGMRGISRRWLLDRAPAR